MKKLSTDSYKGVRDFYPEDKFTQNYIFSIWKKVAELFGYEEYDASILEPSEIYREKSGDEIVNEQTFTFTDRGGREVTLRPEMTPTVARMVAARKRDLGFPLRWYSIPNLFRYEATQRGRLREHWQLNVDIFGVSNISADIEIIVLANKIMEVFGAKPTDYEIRLNTSHADDTDLNKVISELNKSGISNTRIDRTLARGQAYYTGVVFEFFDTDPKNPRSLLGGGRYDNLLEIFGGELVPAVGFGMGDVTVRDFLETHTLLPTYEASTKLCIIPTDRSNIDEIVKLVIYLRMQNLNVAVDWSERKVGDMIKSADKNRVPYVLVFGDDEVKNKVYKIKNLKSGEEKSLKQEEVPEHIKSRS